MKQIALFLSLACLLSACAPKSSPLSDTLDLPPFNELVLKSIANYPQNGEHDYWWPRAGESSYDGCTQDLYLLGERVMEGEPKKRTFCCGLTLEVFLRGYNELLEKTGDDEPLLHPRDWGDFQKHWFVMKLNGPGPSAALEKYEIGKSIPAGEVLPGDFVQIWRTPNSKGKVSGHSVVFLDWIRNEKGRVIGMKYWSTQPSTGGIRENMEYFGPMGGISTENTYYGRVDITAPQ